MFPPLKPISCLLLLRLRKQEGNLSQNQVANTGWLELTNDAFLSPRFGCVPLYGVPLNHESKNLNFLFLES